MSGERRASFQSLAPLRPLVSRNAVARSRGWIDGPGHVGLELRFVDRPQALEIGDRISVRPVHTQIGDGPGDVAHDEKARRVDRKAESMRSGTTLLLSILPAAAALSPSAAAYVPSVLLPENTPVRPAAST
jgi:hypothetical protein